MLNMNPSQEKPAITELIYSDAPLIDIINAERAKSDTRTLVVTDDHNYDSLAGLDDVVLTKNTRTDFVGHVKSCAPDADIIGVGGCRALDVGRALASDTQFISVPTILSTSCLSSDLSVLYRGDVKIRTKTKAPVRTIIPMRTLMEAPADVRDRWTGSGLGDLYSRVSAVIDFYEGNATRQQIESTIPYIFESIEWLKTRFSGFDYDAMKRVAGYLHDASLAAKKVGHTKFSFAGEHALFDEIVAYQRANGIPPATHGQIVSIGTLISAKMYAEQSGEQSVYDDLCDAYERIGLPADYAGLRKINIDRGQVENAFESLKDKDDYIFRKYMEEGAAVIDATYGRR